MKLHKKETRNERVPAPAYTAFEDHPGTVLAPMKGTIIPLEESSDPSFSQGLVGTGVVMIPEESLVCSPVSGKVLMLFPTKSAISIEDAQGREVLLHLGMNTATMEKNPFVCYVAEGDAVQAGQPLMKVDWNLIDECGLSRQCPIVLPEKDGIANVYYGSVKAGEPVFDMLNGTLQA